MSILQQDSLNELNGDGFVMNPEVITTISPSTNKPVLTRNGLSDSDVALLPASSTQAFNSFRLISLEERRSIVSKALKLISEKQDVLAREITEQMGRPIAYTAIEIETAIKRGEYMLKISGDALKDTAGDTIFCGARSLSADELLHAVRGASSGSFDHAAPPLLAAFY